MGGVATAEIVAAKQAQQIQHEAARAKWQNAQLRTASLPAKIVQLPATRPVDSNQALATGPAANMSIVGYVERIDAALETDWVWTRRADESDVAITRFESQGAGGLRLRFADIQPFTEIEIRIADRDGDHVYGPFLAPAVDDEGGWWSPTIWSNVAHVELHAPAGIRDDSVVPRVTDVAFYNAGEPGSVIPGAVASCENDISCFGSWKNNEGRAVALFYNIREGVWARWSGALINRGPGDLSPLFMTSRFAVGTQAEAASVEVYWEYETSSCNGSVASSPANQPRNSGAVRVKGHEEADWSILGLKDPPAASNPFFLGWNSNSWSSGEPLTVIHHPQGSHKRISFGDTGITGQANLCLFSPFIECFDVRHRRVDLDDGRTEIGSTGGPVMDAGRLVRLVVSGREDDNIDCSANEERTYGGRFDLAFDNLKFALSSASIASPVYVNFAAFADPNNDGDSERGTSSQPFNAIHEATFVILEGDDMRITPGIYNERMKIYRPMKLVRQGSSGTVRIGG